MFSLDEKVVYPGHGVARISNIIEKKVAGSIVNFYELTFLNKDMTILVPTSNVISVGIRKLSSQQNIDALFELLTKPVSPITPDSITTNWNKRNKEYQGKIRTGDLKEICEIYKDLKSIETQKELSFGEKNLLSQTEALLVEEISLVNNMAKESATEQLRTLVNNSKYYSAQM